MTSSVTDIKAMTLDEDLRKKNFEAYKAVYGFEPYIDLDEEKKYRIEVARDGEVVLYVIGNKGFQIRMNSTYSPDYEAKRWANKDTFSKRNKTMLIMGISTGVYLRSLVDLYGDDTHFYIYEPCEGLFSYVCGFIDFSGLIRDKNCISFMISEKQAPVFYKKLCFDIIDRRADTFSMVTPGYSIDSFFGDLCKKAEVLINTRVGFQAKRAQNALKNRIYAWKHLKENVLLANLTERIPKGMPAIIVSAGPSLKKNVGLLKKAKGHALIICVDRAVKTLEEMGIMPDLVTSVDAIKGADFVDSDITKNVPLICSMQVNRDIQELFMGRSIYFDHIAPELDLFGENKIPADMIDMDLGGNVSGATFFACQKMNIKTIILLGQDLAFLNGEHHADGRKEGTPIGNRVMVKGIDGSMVESTDIWVAFKDYFERQISMDPELRVIDATEGGALIQGTEVMTLEKSLEEVCIKSFDIPAIFEKLPQAIDDDGYTKSVMTINEWIDDLDMIERNAKELVEVCSSLYKVSKYQDIRDPKNKRKMERLNKLRFQLTNNYSNVLLEKFWIEDIYSIPDTQMMLRTNEEAQDVLQIAIDYYTKLPDYCGTLKDELKQVYEI